MGGPTIQMRRLRTSAELAGPNIYPICDLLEHVKEPDPQTRATGSPHYRASTEYPRRVLVKASINTVIQTRDVNPDQ